MKNLILTLQTRTITGIVQIVNCWPLSNWSDNDFMFNSTGLNATTSPGVNIIFNQDKLNFRATCDNLTASFCNNDDNEDLDIGIDSSYYEIDDFLKCKPEKTSSFVMLCYVNIASINKHINKTSSFLIRL